MVAAIIQSAKMSKAWTSKYYDDFEITAVNFPDVSEVNRILRDTTFEYADWMEAPNFSMWPLWPYHRERVDTEKLGGPFLQAMDTIQGYLAEMVAEIDPGVELFDMWMTQRSKGEFNPLHDHNPGDYSGIYVISDGGSQSGATTFVKDGKELSLPPVEGRAVIFPSTLEHRVEVHEGDERRLTLAFNFVYDRNDEKWR